MSRWGGLLAVAVACCTVSCGARTSRPVDQPFSCGPDATARVQELVSPYIDRARETYPGAKARWKKGLPPGYTFFVTTPFRHSDQHFEFVFVKVATIAADRVSGTIASTPIGPGFRAGQVYEFDERTIVDWTITDPNGMEEGNFVGNFLDRYRGQCPQ